MNYIYKTNEIEKLSEKQKRLVIKYVLFVIGFIIVLTFSCFTVKNNILLTAIFASILLVVIFSSIVFWKVKYGILNKHKAFIDDMEMGVKNDYSGHFEKKESSDSEDFDSYIFNSSNKKTSFLIHRHYSIDFIEGEKYHVEHVGNYIYRWEIIK